MLLCRQTGGDREFRFNQEASPVVSQWVRKTGLRSVWVGFGERWAGEALENASFPSATLAKLKRGMWQLTQAMTTYHRMSSQIFLLTICAQQLADGDFEEINWTGEEL